MEISKEENKFIDEINKLLASINYKNVGIDPSTYKLFRECVNIDLAKHMASQQIPPKLIPIANVEIDGEKIIPIDKKIVTLLDISFFYGVSVEYLAQEYEKCNYDQTSQEFYQLINWLKAYQKQCFEISDLLGTPKLSATKVSPFQKKNTFTAATQSLMEIAKNNNIPFVRLYEAYLRYNDVTVALMKIKKEDVERKMIAQYSKVIDFSMGGDVQEYKRYFSYLNDRDAILRKLYASDADTTDGIYLDEEEFEKLLLVDARYYDDMKFLINDTERMFIKELRNKIMHGQVCIKLEDLHTLLAILSMHRLTLYENTQLFMKLLEKEKVSEDVIQNTNEDYVVGALPEESFEVSETIRKK